MQERTAKDKKKDLGETLNLMADEPVAPRKAAAPKASAPKTPLQRTASVALFDGDDVDMDAKHPTDVPVGNYPAPSQIAQLPENPIADEEDDPFADTVMARLLADEPEPIASPLRAAREDLNAVAAKELSLTDELDDLNIFDEPLSAVASPIAEPTLEPQSSEVEDLSMFDEPIAAVSAPPLEPIVAAADLDLTQEAADPKELDAFEEETPQHVSVPVLAAQDAMDLNDLEELDAFEEEIPDPIAVPVLTVENAADLSDAEELGLPEELEDLSIFDEAADYVATPVMSASVESIAVVAPDLALTEDISDLEELDAYEAEELELDMATPSIQNALITEPEEDTPMPAPAAKEAVSERKAASKTTPVGLKITRRYTKSGQDIWNSVEWELRTAAIVGADGKVVFEQKGVEIPKNWSQLATNVVVSKYFRGHVGTLEREYSVKQLIGRVSDRILEWGKQGNYFAAPEDADAFYDELRFILLHQYAAFNSPVWFNLGWAGRRQAVSACYINEVDDQMESILDLYKTEGMLFKDGSGSGVNLSTLRSSKEPLEAGGRSSGPVSFMKGLDASAGSIKSGGSTRRAACMRVLDVDHPDVKEFIDCKKDAELKAHALIDAGYSGAFNVAGGAYDTVPFQNANHSVRVTDEFMQAVETDGPWETKRRLDGKAVDTYKARDLMRSIAEGTWICGDPGMQYDTTINDWHTCSNTDRIYASNPCVTGDTLVATSDGWQRIDSLVGESARIIGADGQPHFVTNIFPTGHKPVFKLRTRSGFEVTITDNHQVLTVERGDVAVKDVLLGEHLRLEGAGFGRRALDETLALAIGLAAGDGCLVREEIRGRRQEYVILTMAEAEATVLHKVSQELNRQKDLLRAAGISGRPDGANVAEKSTPGTARLAVGSAPVVGLFTEFAVLDEGSAAKRFTPSVFELDKPSLSAVLRGLFTADGTVANYGDKSQYVALDSTSLELLRQTQMLLLSFGIKSKLYTERRGGKTVAMMPNSNREPQEYNVQEMHSLRISRSSRVIFEREIGFDASSAKAARLRDLNLAFTTYKDSMTDEIVSITEAGTADVYDLTEGVTHHFVANGLIVHNCSEYMFLNSTACNLSSLNLMKFRDAKSGAFDTASFEHAVQIMITAQEIVVGFAAYPTEKIEQRSHEYRTLGLGYANLGALLMAAGLPYDSDAGRAYAGGVTAIMTGRAYHQSAIIARDCGGPFPGYAENRDPMLRVIRKHREHVDKINGKLIPDTLLAAARTSWDDALAVGEKNGYRNAQSTVLAPTGCLVAGSLVITDRGVVRLNRLGNVNGTQWQDVQFRVLTDIGQQEATKFYVNGVDDTRRIVTRCGYAIQGTPKHRVKVVDAKTGQWDWKRFGEIASGDVVALSLGQMIGEAQEVVLPPLGEEYWTGDYTTRVPRTMTPELAELIGYFMGDGSLHAKGPRFCVAETDLDVAERVRVLVKTLFNLDAHLLAREGYAEVSVHSVPLVLWWEACGFHKLAPDATHSGKGYLPRVPDALLATNDPAIYGAFLRGLYEADGTVTSGIPCWSTVHREFSEEVKTLLLALGLPTTTRQTISGWGQSAMHVLRLRNTSYTGHFLSAVGFMGERKTGLVNHNRGEQTARYDYVYVAPDVLAELVPARHELANAVALSIKRHNGAITRRAAEKLYAQTGDVRLGHALQFFYDVVSVNEDGGRQETFDLSVPANVTYVANGFISHNTIGFLMDCDTTGIEPDIAIVKYKSLVGGGMMKIVNQTVPEALERLGYSEAERSGIIAFIDEHDTIEGSPDLKPEHLPIFDCAFRPSNGTRSIHYKGHIKMMAAAQPFISGAISKTVNVPHDATPEEIAETYLESWRLGLKAVAIYRDGSKRTQPLNTVKETPAGEKVAASTSATAVAEAPVIAKAVRRRLPDERASITHKFSIGGHEGYITVGLYPDTQSPGEIFIRMAKEGSSISGLMDSFATAISLSLQYGVPLSTLVDKFIHSRFEPSGFTNNKEIPMAKSVMDYIFRWLALKFLQKDERRNVGLLADQEAVDAAYAPAPTVKPITATVPSTGNGNGAKNGNGNGHLAETATAAITEHEREIFRMQSDAPPCPECGAITIRSGACYKCLSCGTSLGCS